MTVAICWGLAAPYRQALGLGVQFSGIVWQDLREYLINRAHRKCGATRKVTLIFCPRAHESRSGVTEAELKKYSERLLAETSTERLES